jgi:TonB family protein
MDTRRGTVIFLLLALVGLARAGRCAESAYKQEPEHLFSYLIKAPVPNYPVAAGTWHKKGEGCFRLNIDRATGTVTEVKVLKSTGVKILDDSAAVAFMQWKIKPHTIDHIILPFAFRGPGESTGTHIKW